MVIASGENVDSQPPKVAKKMTFTPRNPSFEKVVREKLTTNYFSTHLGFIMDSVEPGTVEGHLDLQPHHLQQMGFVHGGVTATLGDIVTGFAAYSLVPEGSGVVTVELSTSYLNPAMGPIIYARGWVIKEGQKLYFCEAEIWVMDEKKDKKLTAKVTAIMALVGF